ncbi:TPA: hypothetical protein ACGAUW_001913, partial [Klebsiella pneumoniae]
RLIDTSVRRVDERWHRDPAHQWLRQFIVNSLEEQTC